MRSRIANADVHSSSPNMTAATSTPMTPMQVGRRAVVRCPGHERQQCADSDLCKVEKAGPSQLARPDLSRHSPF